MLKAETRDLRRLGIGKGWGLFQRAVNTCMEKEMRMEEWVALLKEVRERRYSAIVVSKTAVAIGQKGCSCQHLSRDPKRTKQVRSR